MTVIKILGKVYGAKLTNAEKEAMEIEIRKQIAAETRKHDDEIVARVLWSVMEHFNCGEKKLKRFYDDFDPSIKALLDRYEMDDADDAWLCTRKLKDRGIDIAKWREESEKGLKSK